MAEYIGIKDLKPTLRIIKFEDGDIKKFALDKDVFTKEDIENFV